MASEVDQTCSLRTSEQSSIWWAAALAESKIRERIRGFAQWAKFKTNNWDHRFSSIKLSRFCHTFTIWRHILLPLRKTGSPSVRKLRKNLLKDTYDENGKAMHGQIIMMQYTSSKVAPCSLPQHVITVWTVAPHFWLHPRLLPAGSFTMLLIHTVAKVWFRCRRQCLSWIQSPRTLARAAVLVREGKWHLVIIIIIGPHLIPAQCWDAIQKNFGRVYELRRSVIVEQMAVWSACVVHDVHESCGMCRTGWSQLEIVLQSVDDIFFPHYFWKLPVQRRLPEMKHSAL